MIDVTHGGPDRRPRPPVSRGPPAAYVVVPLVTMPCTHLDQILITAPGEADSCEECARIGGRWLHLRVCLTCGHVGCCDSSPNKHASAHAIEAGHPVIRSAEPGESWCWCYEDQVAFELDQAAFSN